MPSGKIRNSPLFKDLTALVVVVVVSFWSVWPVVRNLGNSLPDKGDTLLITWIQNQHIQKIPHNIKNIFQGNIFYPYKNTLAYSDMFLPSALIAYLPVKLTNLPVVSFNFNLVFGQILTMIVVFLWFKDMTQNRISALLGSIALGISQMRIIFAPHLQMWMMHWWLIALWMIWKYKKEGRVIFLYIAGIFSVVQVWESVLPFFFVVFVGSIILLPEIRRLKGELKHITIVLSIIFILVGPVLSKYWEVSNEFEVKRTIRDAAHHSLSLDEMWGRFFSPGLFSLTLISFVILIGSDAFLKKEKNIKWILVVLVLGFVMSLGPVLKFDGKTVKIIEEVFIPLPYGLFYYIIPGFAAFRTPLRWIWLFALSASAMTALSVSRAKTGLENLLLPTLFLLAFLGGTKIKEVTPVPVPDQYPYVYKFVEKLPGDVIIELPIYPYSHDEEFRRLLFSLQHNKKMVNGYSGIYPPEWSKFVDKLTMRFPGSRMDEELKEMGVDYIIVNKDLYKAVQLQKIMSWGQNKVLWVDEKYLVYELK